MEPNRLRSHWTLFRTISTECVCIVVEIVVKSRTRSKESRKIWIIEVDKLKPWKLPPRNCNDRNIFVIVLQNSGIMSKVSLKTQPTDTKSRWRWWWWCGCFSHQNIQPFPHRNNKVIHFNVYGTHKIHEKSAISSVSIRISMELTATQWN